MTSIEDKAEHILEELVKHRGGQKRDPQIRLAKGLARHEESGVPLVVQAPTGVGKSYAAIAAARATGEQAFIATHTHSLQQQLQSDAIMLAEAMGDFTVAVLKGRSSYFCLLKGDTYKNQSSTDVFEADELQKVLDWSEDTDTGERSELDFAVTNEVWNKVSVSADQCAGRRCPFYRQCFAEKARAKAKSSDLTILNHSLVAQGMRVEEGGLLEGIPNIIIDECHEFPSVVGEAFGATISKSRLVWAFTQAKKLGSVEQAQRYEKAVDKLNDLCHGVKEPIRHLNGSNVLVQVDALIATIRSWIAILESKGGEKNQILKQSLYSLASDLDLISKGDTHTQTAWLENKGEDVFVLRSVLFNPSSVIRERLIKQHHSVAFMSATVKTGNTFAPIARDLGISKMEWVGAEIPHLFDYQHNGLVWLPERMKEPSHPEYHRQVAMVSKAAVKAAQGRTLILCTSWTGVRTIGSILREAFSKEDFPVLMQEPGVNLRKASESFRANKHSVLVGTSSLWTGVSFEGDTCACVIIDKVPFPSPGDPIIAARCEDCEDNDMNSFASILVPEACKTIAQGAGRLIRTPWDQGVLVLPDPRLNQHSQYYKSYAPRILSSLPPMPITYDTQEALSKLRSIHELDQSG